MSKSRGRKTTPAAGRRINEAEFAAVQGVLRGARRQWQDAPAKAPGTQTLAGKVAQTVGYREDHVLAMMERTGIGSFERPVLTS